MKMPATDETRMASRSPPDEKRPRLVTLYDKSPNGLRKNANQVMLQAVQGRAMPLGNETGITDEERAKLGAFLQQGS